MAASYRFKEFSDFLYEEEGEVVCVFCSDNPGILHSLPCRHQACPDCMRKF